MYVLPTSLLKSCADVFGPPSLRSQTHLSTRKSSRICSRFYQVTPLLKKTALTHRTWRIYRLITNLDIIGKIFEPLAQKQLRQHIEQSPNVGSRLSACRTLHSNEAAMTGVGNDLLSTSRQTPAILLVLNISGAFRHSRSQSKALRPCSPSMITFFAGFSHICPVASSSSPSAVDPP